MKKIYVFSAALLMAVSMSAQLGYNVVYSESDFNDANTTVESVGDNAWDGGLRLGGSETGITSGPAWNWDDKYVVIALASGIPASVTFSYANTAVAPTNKSKVADPHYFVYAGATLDNLIMLEERRAKTVESETLALGDSVRYIKFVYRGNFANVYNNIKVAPATTYGEYTGAYCQGDSLEYMGQYYKAGTYEVKTTNYFGGDSIIALTVVENPTYETLVVDTMTVGETKVYYEDREYTATEVGEFYIDTVVVPTEAGCDSTLYFKMVVKGTATATPAIRVNNAKVTKELRQGKLVIICDDKIYNAIGVEIR